MGDRAVVIVRRERDHSERDLDIPLDITFHEFFLALNTIYGIKSDVGKIGMAHLSVENPIVLMKGNKLLKEYGLHDGSIIYIVE